MINKILISEGESLQISKEIIKTVQYILENIGPREPGSESEYRTQKYLAEELSNYANSVVIEPFTVAPMGLLFFFPVTGILVFFSSAVLHRYPLLGLLGIVTSLIIIWFQFGQYRQLLDPFLPKKESNNVYAKWTPSNKNITQRIILCGHADSAYEMRYNQWGKLYLKLAVLSMILSILILLFLSLLFSYEYFKGEEILFIPERIRELSIIFGIIYGIIAISFIRFSRVVPGANDNLSGSITALEVLKWFSKHPFEIQNTEIACLITGSEEAGLRGAMAFVQRHKDELQSIPTVVVTIDTLGDLAELGIVIRDLNGLLHHHRGAISLLYQAGLDCGIALKPVSIFLGSSDATAFTRAGIPASGLVAMDPSPAKYYHTRYDTVDAMSEETLSAGLTVLIQAIKNYDTYGLPQNGPIPVLQKKHALEKSKELAIG
ncbi:MAG TPA: M28 family peptidase [Candidatus Hydrogenedens sp.]|nr:M28 family peptidase [Candidatus Hydrogenedens sp.]